MRWELQPNCTYKIVFFLTKISKKFRWTYGSTLGKILLMTLWSPISSAIFLCPFKCQIKYDKYVRTKKGILSMFFHRYKRQWYMYGDLICNALYVQRGRKWYCDSLHLLSYRILGWVVVGPISPSGGSIHDMDSLNWNHSLAVCIFV